MKITRTKQQIDAAKMRKEIANNGCDVCPCCGETKSIRDYMDKRIFFKGIKHSTPYCIDKGFIRIKQFYIDRYECLTCGAKWESEPYEWM